MNNNQELKACPCGKTPKELHLSESHTSKWAWACGDCCGEWHIEFRTNYDHIESEQCMDTAITCWNDTIRPDQQNKKSIELLDVIKKAYRKHCLNDESIGWEEMDNLLLDTLCNAMGDDGYQKWAAGIIFK